MAELRAKLNGRVAVVGAGLAGLAAALELKDAGLRVELFERSRLLGGRATSFEIDGHEVDNGQHVFLACCTEFIRFARRVGMERHLHLQGRFDARIISRDGNPRSAATVQPSPVTTGRLRTGSLPAPFHLLGSFATYPHLNLNGKLRIARAVASALFTRKSPPSKMASGHVIPSGTSAASAVEGRPTDITFEAWLQRTGQNAQTRRAFWDPFFIPALNAPFDRIDANDALFVLRTAFLRDAAAARFGFSKVPLAHLAAAAAQQLDAVHLSTAVVGIDAERQDRVYLHLLGDRTEAFDAVVLALPPRQLAKLLGDPQKYGLTDLNAYDPYPIVDVHLWHDAGSIGLDFAAALESPLQWIFEKEPGYLCCSFSAADKYLRLPTAELEALAWTEVQTFLPTLKTANLIRSAVTRNPEATWLPQHGTQRHSQRTSHPVIAIAGAWTETGWPDTMESAIRSGTIAATTLLCRRSLPNSGKLRSPASPPTQPERIAK